MIFKDDFLNRKELDPTIHPAPSTHNPASAHLALAPPPMTNPEGAGDAAGSHEELQPITQHVPHGGIDVGGHSP
ncbi:hypothetical protein HYFRA_00013255 [Hymenoscyphus fraxineus]|uniref:Uncharacterized protein n=1 Tax=Hymenoscyphus fraxineus TaxID=746836 RepID=A0A9N9L833_9HELO|nr:hypothetical protein HYFRA_00013255 [Hymenoscyphus fraxineus]